MPSDRVKRRNKSYRKKKRKKQAEERDINQELPNHSIGPIYTSLTETLYFLYKERQIIEKIKSEEDLYCKSCNTLILKRKEFKYENGEILVDNSIISSDHESIKFSKGFIKCKNNHIIGNLKTEKVDGSIRVNVHINKEKTNYFTPLYQ